VPPLDSSFSVWAGYSRLPVAAGPVAEAVGLDAVVPDLGMSAASLEGGAVGPEVAAAAAAMASRRVGVVLGYDAT